MKTGLRLGLLTLIAVVLGVAYFALARDTAPATTGFLYTFPRGDRLQEMRIANAQGSVRFAKQDGKWVIVEPGSYRANQQKAALMEDFLLALPVNRELQSDAPEYGLDQPAVTVELTSAGKVHKVLLVGNLTASKAQVYLKDQASGSIFVSDLGSVTQFDGSLDSFRDKNLFSIDKENIVEFSYYVDGQKQVTVRRTQALDWELTYPYASPARKIEISEFLIGLRKWTAIMYPAPDELEGAGLGLGASKQALEVMDASGQTQRLEFGAEADGLKFVRTGSREDVAGIFSVDVDLHHLTPADLVFYQPLQATIDRVARIELASTDQSVTFALDHKTQPPAITADGKPVPYAAFVSFFVKYIALSADGHDAAANPGTAVLTLKTTYVDGQARQVILLERDAGSKYMQVDGEASFYVSDETVTLLLDRLDQALAAEQ